MMSLATWHLLFPTIAVTTFGGAGGAQQKVKCQLSRADSAYITGKPLYRDCAVDQRAELVGREPSFDFRPLTRLRCYNAVIEFVVDSTGAPEAETAHVLRTTTPDFAEAIVTTLPRFRYRPARKDGVPVRQIVRIERKVTSTIVVSGGRLAMTPPSQEHGC